MRMTAIELSEVVRNYAIVVGGFMGLALALWRGLSADRQSRAAQEQALIDRRAHITGVFKDAVAQLGHERLEIRLGGVFALGQISRDFTDFSEPVVRLLTEYARVQSKGLEGDEAPIDLHEIMNIVRERLT